MSEEPLKEPLKELAGGDRKKVADLLASLTLGDGNKPDEDEISLVVSWDDQSPIADSLFSVRGSLLPSTIRRIREICLDKEVDSKKLREAYEFLFRLFHDQDMPLTAAAFCQYGLLHPTDP